ncbi:MAG: AAA family ATPase [Deferribacteres bacterium]|nr:AAA family ATPase [Deferribacteres bacterium]
MKGKSVYPAKITRPVYAEVLNRERLFHLLDGRRNRPVIWVTGPPGSGKTTLLNSYIDSRKLPCLWYQVDEHDSDPATFFYYMGLAAKKARPRRRQPLPVLTPEYQKSIHAFTRRYFGELFSRLGPPFVIVLDNYHEANRRSLLHVVMREGLSCIPEGVNVVIISRDSMPKELVRLRVNGMVSLVTWEDLQLTLDEAESIIRIRRDVPKETAEILHRRSSGWVAGLVLMLEMGDTGEREDQYPESASHDEVFDYFANEIFDDADAESREFLLKTSVLPVMTPDMTMKLTGLERSAGILMALYQRNYFIARRRGAEGKYQYHPLFREFLLSCAHRTYPGKELRTLRQKAALLLEQAGETEEAANLYIISRDGEGLANLIMKHAERLVAQGRNQMLGQWIRSLPEGFLDNAPWLLFWLAICELPFDPPVSRTWFEQAYTQFTAQGDASGMFMSCCGAVDAILYEQADFKLLDKWITVLEGLFRSGHRFPSMEIKSRAISSMFISLLLRQPSHPEIEEWAQRVLAACREVQDPSLRILSEVDVSLYYQWTGRFSKAEEVIAPLRSLAQDRQVSPLAFTTLKSFEAMCYSLKGMHGLCLETVSEGLEVVRSSGVDTMLLQLLMHGAAGCLGTGDLDGARKLFEEAEVKAGDSQLMNTAYYRYLLAWEALLRNDLLNAFEHINIALDHVVTAGFPFMEAVIRYAMAQVLFERGEHREAAANLSSACRIGRGMKSLMIEYMCLVSEAYFALAAGKKRNALGFLRQAMALGRKHGLVYFIFWRPHVMARLCVSALEAGIEKEYVIDLIKRHNLIPDSPPLDVEDWPWPVKIYTLGRFGLLVDGRPVRFSRKARQKPMALLKALIAFGGRGVGTGRLIDALWPDTYGDAAVSAFTTTIQRLRGILGNEAAVRVSKGKVTLDHTYCWVDAWAFERILSETETMVRHRKSPGKVFKLFEKALGMYNGNFLGDDAELHWTFSMRERLRSRFLRHIASTGEYLRQNGEFKKAIECYKRGLEVDPLAEELYQQLMRCYAGLGYYGEVKKTYHSCLNALSRVLGVKPSPETEAIYKSIP